MRHSKLVIEFFSPKATLLCDESELPTISGSLAYASFPPFTSAPDILRSAEGEFVGLTYALDEANFARAATICSDLVSGIVAARRYDEVTPKYAAQYGHDLFLEVLWGISNPDEIVLAQLADDAWYYQIGPRSQDEIFQEWKLPILDAPRILGIGVSYLHDLLETYDLRLPDRWTLPVNTALARR